MKKAVKFYSILIILISLPFLFIKYQEHNEYKKELEANEVNCKRIKADGYNIVNVSDSVFEKQTYHYQKNNKIISTTIPCETG